ncbi:putative colanic acid biosynthesis acetyltransferase [Chroogloeocystis siderophila]|uniref:Colanic acid biosynthesis acetyltransferase WcaF n=1 Tax=Chroogloeocystis siderophila 5.2 s.c.1 TaxID=247279 RepID=A0A1U7HGG1_9CHRO|nr:putative colanic acid biosynthesis acetyltransferase [Chroogloeocystis siderophila]OKH22667.1 colanic acid biosynthesis acetyltransferase WcaF [Chroogloeocystis siderophila 5.2 s.c.1]
MDYQIQNLKEFRLPHNFRGKPGWYVQLWWLVQSTLFGLSPQFMYAWRRWLLKAFGATVGQKVLIRPTARITYPWKVQIGDYSWIGDDVVLYSLGDIAIGNNVVISQRSYLCAASHDYNSSSFDIFAKPVRIEDEVWLATNVFVAPGVTIGKGAVVGACSSVFRSLPSMMICTGCPAQPLRRREKQTVVLTSN